MPPKRKRKTSNADSKSDEGHKKTKETTPEMVLSRMDTATHEESACHRPLLVKPVTVNPPILQSRPLSNPNPLLFPERDTTYIRARTQRFQLSLESRCIEQVLATMGTDAKHFDNSRSWAIKQCYICRQPHIINPIEAWVLMSNLYGTQERDRLEIILQFMIDTGAARFASMTNCVSGSYTPFDFTECVTLDTVLKPQFVKFFAIEPDTPWGRIREMALEHFQDGDTELVAEDVNHIRAVYPRVEPAEVDRLFDFNQRRSRSTLFYAALLASLRPETFDIFQGLVYYAAGFWNPFHLCFDLHRGQLSDEVNQEIDTVRSHYKNVWFKILRNRLTSAFMMHAPGELGIVGLIWDYLWLIETVANDPESDSDDELFSEDRRDNHVSDSDDDDVVDTNSDSEDSQLDRDDSDSDSDTEKDEKSGLCVYYPGRSLSSRL